MAPILGNFGVILKSYAYIMMLGKQGLIDVSENAVLSTNYIRAKLKKYFYIPYDKTCMHEFIISAKTLVEKGIRAIDIAKYLIDKGIHPPTIYFPLIVPEAIMIEPTETESKETLDNFIEIMKEISRLAQEDPNKIINTPKTTLVNRLDETKAARDLCIRWHSA
jgi:glycine dehydrogenase subunit 2